MREIKDYLKDRIINDDIVYKMSIMLNRYWDLKDHDPRESAVVGEGRNGFFTGCLPGCVIDNDQFTEKGFIWISNHYPFNYHCPCKFGSPSDIDMHEQLRSIPPTGGFTWRHGSYVPYNPEQFAIHHRASFMFKLKRYSDSLDRFFFKINKEPVSKIYSIIRNGHGGNLPIANNLSDAILKVIDYEEDRETRFYNAFYNYYKPMMEIEIGNIKELENEGILQYKLIPW